MYPHVPTAAEACVGAVRPGDERSPNEAAGCGSRTMILRHPAKLVLLSSSLLVDGLLLHGAPQRTEAAAAEPPLMETISAFIRRWPRKPVEQCPRPESGRLD